MSYKNPNHNEVWSITKGIVDPSKDYLNLAKFKFMKKFKRKPSLDDAKILRQYVEEEWEQYYISMKLVDYNYKQGKDLLLYCLDIKVDFKKALEEFVGKDEKYKSTYIKCFNKTNDFIKFVDDNRQRLKHTYKKRHYQDFSHLAYNDVTNDF